MNDSTRNPIYKGDTTPLWLVSLGKRRAFVQALTETDAKEAARQNFRWTRCRCRQIGTMGDWFDGKFTSPYDL